MNRYNTKVDISKRLQTASALVFFSLFGLCNAAVVTWDGGGTGGTMGYGWQWGVGYESAWDGDVNPGADDEAVFPASMTRTSISLYNDTAVGKLTFNNQGPLSVGGTSTITTTNILVRNTNDSPATNQLTNIMLGGNGEITVEATKILRITSDIKNDGFAYSLKKTGAGSLWIDKSNSYTGNTFVAQGTLRLSAALKGYNIVIGDGVHAATLETLNMLGMPDGAIVTVNTNAFYKMTMTTPVTYYPETYVINGGTLDAGGNSLYMYNVGATASITQTVTMVGGTITNGALILNCPSADYTLLSTKASVATARIPSRLHLQGWRSSIAVENGPAIIDLDVSGPLTGTLTFRKTGAGVMALTSPTGGTVYKSGYTHYLDAGTLLVDNVSGTGTGSNGVSVAGGATLGGTGTIYGAQNQAHVTLTGSSDSLLAAIAPGTLDRTTGAELCGTLTLGNAADVGVTNNVTFGNYSVLRAQLGREGSGDRLDVFGALNLASSLNKDKLDIIAPTVNVPSGDHVLVTFSNLLTGRFDAVTLNGGALPSNYTLEYRDAGGTAVSGTANIVGSGSIVLIVPPTETLIIIR